MNNVRIFFALLLFSATTSLAQQVESGDLFIKIESIITNMPGSSGNDYIIPDVSQLTQFGEVVGDLLNAEYNQAATKANSLGYELIAFTDNSTNKRYYILENISNNHWGTYVFNPDYQIPLVVQSPHPRYDTNTGFQGIYVFEEIDALFYCVAGTHRCNNSTFSTCSGTTSACGTSGPYKISDMAHNTASVFQMVTDSLFTHYPDSYFISLHGFSKGDSDPYVILSNGTRETPKEDYILKLSNNLKAQDNVLTTKIAHINTSWTRLIGFTNTQGRLINSSTDACSTSATTTSGRFIHMEQEKSRLRSDENGWEKVANALKHTFSDPVTGLALDEESQFVVYPNPTSDYITITGIPQGLKKIRFIDLLNREFTLPIEVSADKYYTCLDISEVPAGIYILQAGTFKTRVFIR